MADGAGKPHSHLVDFPEALEVLFSRLGELKLILGPAAAPGVDRVQELLRAGLAARERLLRLGAPLWQHRLPASTNSRLGYRSQKRQTQIARPGPNG
jgi:hypothetical protein